MAIELEWTPVNLLATGFGLFFLLWGSVSFLFKERLFVGEAPIAVLVGVLLGPYGLSGAIGWSSKEWQSDQLGLALARLVIGIQLTLVGVQLPYKYPWIELRSLAMLLLPVMTTMWMATTLCIYLAIPDLPVLASLVISTSATPTDPVLSASIVKGAFSDQYVSPRVRNLISAESGANDGFGYTFLYLAVHLLKLGSPGEALQTWLLETCLYTVLGSVAYGTLVGYLCRKLLEFSTRHNWIDKESFLLYGSAMAVFLVGSGGVLQFDDLLAAFVAGNALSWTDFYREQCEESEVDNCLDLVLNLVFFTFLGATIPWDSFNAPDKGVTPVRLVLMSLAVLLFRRLPAMLAFWRFVPTLHDVSEAAFVGYFAPIGAGAFFYLEVVLDEFGKDADSFAVQRILDVVKPVTYALIISSIIGHTLAIPLVKVYFEYRGVGSIKLEGESDQSVSAKSSVAGSEDEGEAVEEEYEEGGHPFATGPDGREGGGAAASSAGSSYRQFSSHQTATRERRRSTGLYPDMVPYGRPSPRSQHQQQQQQQEGAYTSDGRWIPDASWRHSSGHKLGPHHRLRRNEDGEIVLEPDLYTREAGAPGWQRSRGREGRQREGVARRSWREEGQGGDRSTDLEAGGSRGDGHARGGGAGAEEG